MSDSVDPDETAHYEPSHLDLCCLQKPIIIACGSERVNDVYEVAKSHNIALHVPTTQTFYLQTNCPIESKQEHFNDIFEPSKLIWINP